MKYRISMLLLTALLIASPTQAGSFANPSNADSGKLESHATESGTIDTINLQTRAILIQEKPYILSDNLTVFLPDKRIISQLYLAPGQEISFWTKQHGNQILVTKIVIQAGLNTSNIPPQ